MTEINVNNCYICFFIILIKETIKFNNTINPIDKPLLTVDCYVPTTSNMYLIILTLAYHSHTVIL